MPLDRHIQFAQLWLEQVRDHLADAAATSTPVPPEQLNIMSGKVAAGLQILTEAAPRRRAIRAGLRSLTLPASSRTSRSGERERARSNRPPLQHVRKRVCDPRCGRMVGRGVPIRRASSGHEKAPDLR